MDYEEGFVGISLLILFLPSVEDGSVAYAIHERHGKIDDIERELEHDDIDAHFYEILPQHHTSCRQTS